MRLSVVLPTHNRPGLLPEAVASVRAQTWCDWELIVVDDGSSPPASKGDDANLGSRLGWLRNDPAQGPSQARNRGIEAACGDVVTFLDDDDLLSTGMLEAIARGFEQHPELECLFVNVDPFGASAEGMRANQQRNLVALLQRLGSPQAQQGVVLLGSNLFEALLGGLPLAFQRVAIRRSALSKTGLYAGNSFGDLEWNFRVALRCRCALLLQPLYRVRCEGQSFFTRNDARQRLNEELMRIYAQLAALPEVRAHPALGRRLRGKLAEAHFDKAYLALTAGQRMPWGHYWRSLAAGLAWRHVSLLLRWAARARPAEG